jgi:hypothetical protein
MLAATANRELFSRVRAVVGIDDLQEGPARRIYLALEESYRNEQATSAAVLERIEDDELRAYLAAKLATEEFIGHGRQIVEDSLNRVRERRFRAERDDLVARLRRAEAEGDTGETVKQLLADKMHLDEEIRRLRSGGR